MQMCLHDSNSDIFYAVSMSKKHEFMSSVYSLVCIYYVFLVTLTTTINPVH